jgi:hypothetical protein
MPTPTQNSGATAGPVVATAKTATPTAEKHRGNRSLRSKGPPVGTWWLRCQTIPTPCITKRWAR